MSTAVKIIPQPAAGKAAYDVPHIDDFVNINDWFAALEAHRNAADQHLMRFIELTKEIAQLPNWNGPSGSLLGQRLHEEEHLRGVGIIYWSIVDVVDFIKRVGIEYNEKARRSA